VFNGTHKIQRKTLPLILLEEYHKDGREFLNHIVSVTGDKTWTSSVNVHTKQQSKQWIHTQSPNTSNEFKQKMSARQKPDSKCFLGHGRGADSGVHATRNHNNIRSVLKNTLKRTVYGHSE
jgi:hypothetical protein